jgi:membrane protein YdbS with pleckstrin-like domain
VPPATDPPATDPPAANSSWAAPAAGSDPALWPAGAQWRAVSPKLLVVRRLGLAGWLPFLLAAAVVSQLVTGQIWIGLLIGFGGLALLAWWWILIGRAVRSWGYAERDDDLLIRHGVLIRRLTVVPYGRMQFVDVRVGPVERSLGLATIRLHTAAAATDAFIPGVPSDEAARLREKLAALGEARAAGL